MIIFRELSLGNVANYRLGKMALGSTGSNLGFLAVLGSAWVRPDAGPDLIARLTRAGRGRDKPATRLHVVGSVMGFDARA